VIIAHISGFPLEELVPLAGGTGGLLAVRAWLRMRIRGKIKG
jgi:alpha-beta hydrolase superfamily lysophospholipase